MLIGIVGKPNCGKSTFFKALTLADIEIANYPFATIKPNHGMGFVKINCVDKEFGTQCNPREGYCVNHKRFVPVEFLDVAGLVPGAHEGKGMGNQFLSDLNQADALIHVIDCSGGTNEKGESVKSHSHNPANDIKFLETELDYWYFGILERGWAKFARQIQQEHRDIAKALAKQLSGLGVDEDMSKQAIKELGLSKESPGSWTKDGLMKLSTIFRKKTKPIIIAANKIDVDGAFDNYNKLMAEFPELTIIPCSAESELALKEAEKHKMIDYIAGEKDFNIIGGVNDKQKKGLGFIKENVLNKFVEGTGVQSIINGVVFDILNYIAIFPGGVKKLEDQYGNVLPDCFLIKNGSTALDFAYKIHSDIGDKFIRAIDVKTKMAVGKEYKLKHGDVMEIIT